MTFRRFLLALVLPAAFAAPAAADTAPVDGAQVAVSECETTRTVAFTGEMEAVKGASRMQMKFVLQSLLPGTKLWKTLDAPGFGVWTTAQSGVRRYSYTKRVASLIAPARYRATVRFRWSTAAGDVVKRKTLTTKSCSQPDLRADLVPGTIEVEREDDGSGARYAIPLTNDGKVAARAFDVAVTVNGTALTAQRIDALDPRETVTVSINGPICQPGSTVFVNLDPAGAVDERNEKDNLATLVCA